MTEMARMTDNINDTSVLRELEYQSNLEQIPNFKTKDQPVSLPIIRCID